MTHGYGSENRDPAFLNDRPPENGYRVLCSDLLQKVTGLCGDPILLVDLFGLRPPAQVDAVKLA